MKKCDFRLHLSTSMNCIMILSWCYAFFYNCRESFLFGKFLSKFFYVLREFLSFISFYSVVIFAFAKSYENARMDSDFLLKVSSEDIQIRNTYQALYSTFRASLNIVEVSIEKATITMMVIHVCFVLVVPFLSFNFIIGVISARLSAISELEEELSILFRMQNALFFDFGSKDFLKKISCGKKRISVQVQLVLSEFEVGVDVDEEYDETAKIPNPKCTAASSKHNEKRRNKQSKVDAMNKP